jgi:hypothetical protein
MHTPKREQTQGMQRDQEREQRQGDQEGEANHPNLTPHSKQSPTAGISRQMTARAPSPSIANFPRHKRQICIFTPQHTSKSLELVC